MTVVLTYDTSQVTFEQIMAVFPRHQAYYYAFRESHTIFGIGPFADRKGAMGLFADRATAELFASKDPFVLEGIVSRHEIREWGADLS